MRKPAELDQPAQGSEESIHERELPGQNNMDKDWRKVAEEICQESTPERILALSRELIELLDKKREPSRVIEMRMRKIG